MRVEQICPVKQTVNVGDLSVIYHKEFYLSPFDEIVIQFSNRLSKRILSDKSYGRIPAIAALAYWLRTSNLRRIVNENIGLQKQPNVYLSPIGIVFHICPANVDTMFIYSMIVSLLMGNKNILRVSKRLDHEYIDFLFEILNTELATKESELASKYINIITYEHDININEYFSKVSNARLIWGGDLTAKTFKSVASNPRIKDIVFADRISLSLFNTGKFLVENIEVQQEIVNKFYNDSYTFDQLGCSSPQTILLLGEANCNKKFIKIFYSLLENISDIQYGGDNTSLASMKFNQLVNDVTEDKVLSFQNDSATLYLVETNSQLLGHGCGGGYFYTYNINSLEEIKSLLQNKVQTISYFGLEKSQVNIIAKLSSGIGIDRIVPIGKALDFDYIWDGYNLCEELSSKKLLL